MLYPLEFHPIFRRYLWGGRRLSTVLNKSLGAGEDYAESWEVVDRGAEQSVVATGPLAGKTLGELVDRYGADLLGPQATGDRFPLLFKWLDCQRNLSVQVHPNDEQAARLSRPDGGKTEAWVVLDARPESKIYAGLKRGIDRHALACEVARGTTELCLNSFEPRVGDCVFIPAGTVHALGSGLLVAEIQQSSDTTFRLFDWNRLGPDNQPRALHIDQSLDTIDYDIGPIAPQTPQPTDRPFVERLVECGHFVMDRWQFDSPQRLVSESNAAGSQTTPACGFHLLAVMGGQIQIDGASDFQRHGLGLGQTILIPAAVADRTVIRPHETSTLLDIYLPSRL